jgi:hypothetical protein
VSSSTPGDEFTQCYIKGKGLRKLVAAHPTLFEWAGNGLSSFGVKAPVRCSFSCIRFIEREREREREHMLGGVKCGYGVCGTLPTHEHADSLR